jgi:subtilisin family serine protease
MRNDMRIRQVNKLAKYFILLLIPLFAFGFYTNNTKVLKNNNVLYMSHTVVVKLKNVPSSGLNKSVSLSSGLSKVMNVFNVNSVKTFLQKNNTGTGLDKIVIMKYDSNDDPNFVSSQLKATGEVEWAEPKFLYHVDFTPNDPSYASQTSLVNINAPAAWDSTTGDTTVVIGIVDTGVDWPHPDLAANIYHNWAEIPGNGIDDDHNGYIDDYHGWDFGGLGNNGIATPDNNPIEDRPDHGTHVAGIASAVTNNGVGIASIGYKCKILPVKTSEDDIRDLGAPLISFGFEGIVYAADNHARVINCSWGGGGFSLLGQETIDYAMSKGAVVVCAAGNDNSTETFYPANYNGVLSVASTTSTDARSSFSNYGHGIGVCAPGSGIYSTWQPDTYATESGTSMASPLAAGVCALVASKFPQYTADQIREQVRVNCDNISAQNPGLTNMLGGGRINAFKSVTNINSKSSRAIKVTFSDEAPGGNNNGVLEPGETITVRVQFENYLSPTSSLSVTLASQNTNAAIVNGVFNQGAIGTLKTFDNSTAPFTFKLSQSIPSNTSLDFLLNFSDGTYSDFQWLNVSANPNFATQSGNDITLTLTAKGNLGFNDYPNDLQGNGFHFQDGPNYMFEGALMLGTSSTKFVDCARNSGQQVEDADYIAVQPFKINIPGNISNIQGSTVFNDNKATTNKLGVNIHLQSYSYIDQANKNYIILRYTIKNTSVLALSGFYAGLYFDWDMIEGSGANDLTAWDNTGSFGYVHHQGSSPDTTIGIGLLSATNYGFYAVTNSTFGYDVASKWTALSSGLTTTSAGPTDIANITSSGPYTIAAGDSIDVGFALAGDVNLDNVRTAIINARVKYNSIITGIKDNNNQNPITFELNQNYPNPFNPSTVIKYSLAAAGNVTIKVYDILGNEIKTIVNENKAPGTYSVTFDAKGLPSGVYLYKLTAGNYTSVKKLVLLK